MRQQLDWLRHPSCTRPHVGPCCRTVEMAKRNSRQRIDPLIEESEVLSSLVKPARARDSGNTVLTKAFQGGLLAMTGANSAVGLRSMPGTLSVS